MTDLNITSTSPADLTGTKGEVRSPYMFSRTPGYNYKNTTDTMSFGTGFSVDSNGNVTAASVSTGTSITPGTLLASYSYGTATQTTYTLNQSTVYQVLDATNLTISFTVPASGKFYVDIGIDWGMFPADAGYEFTTDCFLGICLHGDASGAVPTTILGYPHSIGGLSEGALTAHIPGIGSHACSRFLVSGQTPGPMQIDVIGGLSGNTDVTAQYYVQNGGALSTDPTAPCDIQVFAA